MAAKKEYWAPSSLPPENEMGTSSAVLTRGEKFLELFQEGRESMRELLQENERLRHHIACLEPSLNESSEETASPELKQELQRVLIEKAQMEEETQDFAQRYLEIEDQNNNLANLYVASLQLHATLDLQEVTQVIQEIIVNLVAAEKFALLLLDEQTQRLTTIAAAGFPSSEMRELQIGEGRIGDVAQTGDIYFSENDGWSEDFAEPLACIPLKIRDRVIGVIAIHQLMTQKNGFSAVDYELFDFLSGQAAIAILSAKLYSESSQHPNTIESFLSLLSSS